MNSKELKEFRKAKNLSRDIFAKGLGISVHTLDSWEKGSRNIPKSKLMLIQSVYNKDNVANDVVPIEDIKKVIEIITFNEEELMKNKYFANWLKLKQEIAINKRLTEIN